MLLFMGAIGFFVKAKPLGCAVFWVYILSFLSFLASARCNATIWSIYLNGRFERFDRLKRSRCCESQRKQNAALVTIPRNIHGLPKLLNVTGMFALPIRYRRPRLPGWLKSEELAGAHRAIQDELDSRWPAIGLGGK